MRLGFFWDSALPATLFDVSLKRPSRRTLDASVATFLLVDFAFAIARLLSLPRTVIVGMLATGGFIGQKGSSVPPFGTSYDCCGKVPNKIRPAAARVDWSGVFVEGGANE